MPAGKYHQLACARHLRDRARENTPAFPYRFSLPRAALFFRFASLLKHYKGEWAGTFIKLEPYQLFRLGSLFGWVRIGTDPRRRFRTSYSELPRKNGKSLEAAIVALYVTFFDHEGGAEGYCIATKRDQARIVFNDAKELVAKSALNIRIRTLVGNLNVEATASKLQPLGADSDSTDGLNPNLVIVDEFHAHKNRKLIDVMETATGARRQPVTFQITTAGDDPVSPCGDQHDYACKILDGVIADETFFAFIAHADPEDDWTLESTWAKANPNYGVSVQPADLAAMAFKAINMPSAAPTFKQKHLNLWVNTDQPWLSIDGWKAGQTVVAAATKAECEAEWEKELLGQSCWVGVDLASKIDLMALILVFPPKGERNTTRLLRWIWTPADTLKDRALRDRAPYDVWRDKGYLTAVPGVRMNPSVIRDVLKVQRKRFRIEGIGFDPWHAAEVMDDLITIDGFPETKVVEVNQTFKDMSAPSISFEATVLEHKVDACNDPVMAWCVSNVVAQRDGKDNLQPIKKKSRGRIDPVVAAIIGFRMADAGKPTRARRMPMIWTPKGFVPAVPPTTPEARA